MTATWPSKIEKSMRSAVIAAEPHAYLDWLKYAEREFPDAAEADLELLKHVVLIDSPGERKELLRRMTKRIKHRAIAEIPGYVMPPIWYKVLLVAVPEIGTKSLYWVGGWATSGKHQELVDAVKAELAIRERSKTSL